MRKILFLFLVVSNWAMAQDNEEVLKFAMDTRWTERASSENTWNEYPRPQMKRENWQNLNGLWEYAIVPVSAGQPEGYLGKIRVPYAVESELSGVKKLVGEENNLWYRTTFKVPTHSDDERIQLNFGAVDWEATLYINGKEVGSHKGGFTPFSFDITPFIKIGGLQELVLKVWDPTDSGTQPRGKQVANPHGIWYTPVTGIWQTVWLEKTSKDYIRLIKNTPSIDNSTLESEIHFGTISRDLQLKVTAKNGNKEVTSRIIEIEKGDKSAVVSLGIPDQVLWSPNNPYLYDLEVELLDNGRSVDKVSSYFGMRKISLGKDGNGFTRILLNNEPLFQFGLLDQGWWPDGLYTAPSREAMMYDVEMTRKWGFNMIRKHVKVEPAIYYYECDKMGMLVWQDMPNGNHLKKLRIQAWEDDAKRSEASSGQFESELKEMMDQLHSFPSIVVWVPFNEGWGQYDTQRVTKWTEEYDPSRLIDSPSGWADRQVGDMLDIHLYPGPGLEYPEENRASVLGEYAGIGWAVPDHIWWDKKNWGYLTYENQSEFKTRFREMMDDLISLKSFGLSAAVYTQTTDVEGEVNGLMTYDREVIKIDPRETSEMMKPVYEKVGRYKTIVADSEHSPNTWKLSNNPGKKWPLKMEKGKWENMAGPFSSYDNYFLPDGSTWGERKDLNILKEFDLEVVPENFILRYYLDKSSMNVFINGKKVTSEKDEGGRKRHYRNKVIPNASKYLRTGKNVLAVKIKADKEDHSFDMGLYTVGEARDNNKEENRVEVSPD
ncbi:glycoside hydrolase family 2 protein [Sinomicrobium sp. M5D2P17]